MQQLIEIGKIINTHGLKGELKIQTNLQDAFVLKNKTIKTSKDHTFEVENIRQFRPPIFIIKFKNFNDINDVEVFKGLKIFSNITEIKKDNDPIIADGFGMKAFFETKEIGTVIDVKNYGAQDLLEIELENKKTEFIITDDAELDIKNNRWILKYDPTDI